MIRATMGFGAAALLLAAATLLAADSAAGAEKTPEEELRDVAAETFAGVKDALAAGDEALGLRVVEGSLRVAWALAKLTTLKQSKTTEDSHIAEMEELWQKREEVHEQALTKTKAAYEEHIEKIKEIYQKERAQLKALMDEMAKRGEALEAENKALRARLGEKPESPAGQKPAAESEAAKPPAKLNELLAAARAYLAAPANETQAARQVRQKKILDGLAGREFVMAAALFDVKPTKKSGEFRAEFRQKPGPAETVILRFASSDDRLVALAVGDEKTIRFKVTGLSFANTRKQAWGESIEMWEPGKANVGIAFIVEGTDARLTP
jgi:regulator of replication initiation timing